jgi:tetratricopeptide (TPR) repeat protein
MSKNFHIRENAPFWYSGNSPAELLSQSGNLKAAESLCLSSLEMDDVLFIGNPKTAKKVLAMKYGQLGNVYVLSNKIAEAEKYYKKALVNFLEADKHSEGIGITYANLGITYELTGNLSEALKCWIESQFVFSVIGDKWRGELTDKWIKEVESRR